MTEKIALCGGPRDSEVLEFEGGDTVQFPVYEPIKAGYDFDAKNEPIESKTALYRRSLRDRGIFVFQP